MPSEKPLQLDGEVKGASLSPEGLGSNRDTAGLSERYGVEICTPNALAPEPSLLTEH